MGQTYQRLINGDARDLSFLDDESIHLVVTSPPYWNLKRYNEVPDQLGHIDGYENFLFEIEKVWQEIFRIWNITGASTRNHPAPFPLELAIRLVRMFSFHGDTVLDPFCGTGTTMIAALRYERNCIGIDIDPEYCRMAARYLKRESSNLFLNTKLIFEKMIPDHSGHMQIHEDQALYEIRSARKTMQ